MNKKKFDGNKILVAEDHEQLRIMIAKRLTIAGFQVLEAIDRESAIKIMVDNKDLKYIITDNDMCCKGAGLDVVKFARMEYGESIEIWLMSGIMSDEVSVRAYGNGANKALAKPHAISDALTELCSKAH